MKYLIKFLFALAGSVLGFWITFMIVQALR